MLSFFFKQSSGSKRKGGTQTLCDRAGCTPVKPALPIAFPKCCSAFCVGNRPLKEMRAWGALEPTVGVGGIDMVGKQAAVSLCGEGAR